MQKLLNNHMTKHKKKILIVEDEPALIKNLTLALSDDYTVVATSSGGEAFTMVKQEKPDLILLDINLPDKDGIEVLKELKQDDETDGVPVLVLTNLSDEDTVSRILEAGGKDYLVKADWSIDSTAEKIRSIID